MANLVGGRYRVMTPLGAGILGYVVRVRDERTGEDKAIKFFKSQSLSESAMGRFEREFQAVSRIAHPNVVQVHEWGVHGGRPYFVMEYLEGDPLDAWAQRVRPAADAPGYDEFARAVAGVFGQIADALAAVHAAGVVHRDVKPENVIVAGRAADGRDRVAERSTAERETSEGHVADFTPPRAKLFDFGHSKDEDERDLTTSGTVVGTASYMAPETASGATPAPSADLYALGCLLYQALVGRPPFHGRNVMEVLMSHVQAPAPDARDVDPRAPAALAELVLALMKKSPAERPSSAADVAATLTRVYRGLPPT